MMPLKTQVIVHPVVLQGKARHAASRFGQARIAVARS